VAKLAVTVLIDTYNHERFIEEAIVSVLEQDFPREEMEVLVVDDGSTDRTPEIVRKFAPRVRLLRKTNGGQASAFNAGIPEAQGEIIAFLDGDDWWASHKLSRVTQCLNTHAEIGVLGHGFYQIDSDSGVKTATQPEISRAIGFASTDDATFFRQMMCFFGTSRVAIRKGVVQRILPIPESMRIEADEFMSTMSIAYSRAVLLPDLLTFYRLHTDNLFQIRSLDSGKLRRLQRVLEAMATELPVHLARAPVSPDAIRILVHASEIGSKYFRLRLDGGWPWETFQVEHAEQQFFYEGGTLGYRLFRLVSLGLTLVMPPRRYYQLCDWYGSSRFRKWRAALGEPTMRPKIRLQTHPAGTNSETESLER